MTSSHGFLAGLLDFLTAPLLVYRMHKRLIQLNPVEKNLRSAQKHQLERERRLHLRERMKEFYSNSPRHSRPSVVTSTGVIDSGGLFQPLVRIWFVNVGLILFLAVLSHLFSVVRTCELLRFPLSASSILDFISHFVSGILRICLPLFMELVNTLYLKKICDRIALLFGERVSSHSLSVNQTNSALGAVIMDRVYTLIFFIFFQLQWTIICHLSSDYQISHLFSVFSVAFLYACYAIEYRWRQIPGRTFEGFLSHVLDHWTYFVGYGLFLGLGCQQLPEFIGLGGMFLSVMYPILVIGALGAHHSKSHGNHEQTHVTWLEDQIICLFRWPLRLSMRPPLFCTNLIVRSCVGAAYQLWF